MQTCGGSSRWYAVRIAAGREKAAASQLECKGYEAFLPLYRSRRQWSDRIKELELPLFAGYLFCRFDFNNRLPILITPGVQSIVGFGKAPTPVSDAEVDALRKVIASGAAAEPHAYLSIGQRVRILEGSLTGLEGVLIDLKNSWRIVLSVELLRRSVAVEIDRAAIAPIRSGPAPARALSAGGARALATATKAAY
jgi:transcription antitermination factor NusG